MPSKYCPLGSGENCNHEEDYCGWIGEYMGLPFFACANADPEYPYTLPNEDVLSLCGWPPPQPRDVL